MTWISGEPPQIANKYFIVWCLFETSYPFQDEIRPALIWWNLGINQWDWDDSEQDFWGQILFYCEIQDPDGVPAGFRPKKRTF